MSSIHMQRTESALEAPALDPIRVIRGASRGFSVLAIGGAIQPLVGAMSPIVGYFWLVVVAVASFGVAAWQAGETELPATQGAVTAAGAYLLIIPLVLMGAGSLPWEQLVLTLLTALTVGAAVGWLRSR